MKVGIPKGLLYYDYHPFFHTFFEELGAEIITSDDTNKAILDMGVKHCVDEACLPVKVFHGHVAAIKDTCDMLVIPRIMQLRKREYICPKFCGLPEMLLCSISDMPRVTATPFYATSKKKMFTWAKEVGKEVTKSTDKIQRAFEAALQGQESYKRDVTYGDYNITIALAGHPYNIYDKYINMNIIKKLNKLGVTVVTEESVDDMAIDKEVAGLYKKPFWSFARNNYGFTAHVAQNKTVDGVIYLSSFACGIDSVVVELIKYKLEEFPMLLIKLDEHTGEAGLDTRLEAFVDMLERRG